MNDALLRLVLILIALGTIVSGVAQLVAPGSILALLAHGADALSLQLFATVGMFMAVTGAIFLQALLTRSPEGAIPLWIGVQKAAAALLVTWAVAKGVFARLALGVAAFDAASAVLAFVFLARLRR